jgi:asparagine synthase (glutamine-hydrolysing)
LAHARLSIIDLATGEQPIANEDGSVWVVFNGEIFNYIELRRELESLGHAFRTQSDTEVLVHAYEQYGDAFLERLNGQFAIAMWDQRRQRLLLARDRAGIRPLFYMEEPGRLLFASEVKALQPCLRQALALDPRGLAQIFTFWSTVGAQTVFERVQLLPAGHSLVIERGSRRLTRYWDWSDAGAAPTSVASFEDAAVDLRALLVDAVRLQLRSDVPVGAYLSGGLDSSGIVSLIKSFTSTPLRTFSVTFDDAEFDETTYQQDMVRHLATDHTTVRCSQSDIGRIFPRLVLHTETPILRTGPAPLMLLSGLVRQAGYKVVLTGEGADEVFAGYDIFKEAKIRRFWARQPESAARAALLGKLYPYLRHSPVGNRAYAQSFYGQGLEDVDNPFYAHGPRWSTTRRVWNFLSRDMRARLADYDPTVALKAQLPPGFERLSGLSRDQYVEAQTLLAGYLLSSQGDRVAMANSVEGRFPYLDHRVIEFANALPARYKLRGLNEKAVLRAALKGLLPNRVLNRVKQPYRAPDSASFFQAGKPLDYVAQLLEPARIRDSGYFESAAVTKLLEKCRGGRTIGFGDNMAFVGILSTMLVDELIVRGRNVDELTTAARAVVTAAG